MTINIYIKNKSLNLIKIYLIKFENKKNKKNKNNPYKINTLILFLKKNLKKSSISTYNFF